MTEPTYLRSAVEDWKAKQITTGCLIELWKLPFRGAFIALLEATDHKTMTTAQRLPTERIMEILRGARG